MIDEKKLIEDIKAECEINAGGLYVNEIIGVIHSQPKVCEWIPVSERLPDERDSIFAKFKGTRKWVCGMFEKISDDVSVTVEYENGTRITQVAHTMDGKWSAERGGNKVIAWMQLPEPYKGE